jgi:hypothetical protein
VALPRIDVAFSVLCVVGSMVVGLWVTHLGVGGPWSVGIAGIAASGFIVARQRGWAHPLAWFPALYGGYFLLGSRNWVSVSDSAVSFRGAVSDNALRLPLLAFIGFVGGTLFAFGRGRAIDHPVSPVALPPRSDSAYRLAARACFVIGSVGVLMIVARSGVPLLHPSLRSDVPGLLRLVSSMLVPAGILAFERTRGRERLLLTALSVLELTALAYRTPVLLMALSILFAATIRREISTKATLAVLVVAVATSTTIYTYRVAHGNGQSSHIQATGPLRYMPALTPLYYSYAREGVAVWAQMTAVVPSQAPYFGGRVQMSALESLLPGRQTSPRLIVAELAYQTGSPLTSLTPTILGGPYLDFGVLGVVIELVLLGILTGWLFVHAKAPTAYRALSGDLAYAYVAALVALSVHTGILDAALLVAVPGATLVVFALAKVTAAARATALHAQSS